MNIVQTGEAYIRAGLAIHDLGRSDTDRAGAIETLVRSGSAALPLLHACVAHTSLPKRQFGAAIALHRLGDPAGLEVLDSALRWRIGSEPQIQSELEVAFVAVGGTAAVTALVRAWEGAKVLADDDPATSLVCHVWAALRDPRAIEPLCAAAARIPRLFVETVAVFGQMALRNLATMALATEPQIRLLAARGLARIPGADSAEISIPMLRDVDPDVREAAANAVSAAIGATATVDAVLAAIQGGFSSAQAIHLIGNNRVAGTYSALLAVIDRWGPATQRSRSDTAEAVQAAIMHLGRTAGLTDAVASAITRLLARTTDTAIARAALDLLSTVRPQVGAVDDMARQALFSLSASGDPFIRERAAALLSTLGDPLPAAIHELIRISLGGSFSARLDLFGTEIASETSSSTISLQRVVSAISRLSRDALDRFAGTPSGAAATAAADERTGPFLSTLLDGCIAQACSFPTGDAAVTDARYAVAVIRTIAGGGTTIGDAARPALRNALYCVPGSAAVPRSAGRQADPGVLIRTAAADAWIQLFGSRSIAVLVEALWDERPAARATAAAGLGRLGDGRALSILARVAEDRDPDVADEARTAIAILKKQNPEMMTLLRGSSVEHTHPETLLRPASAARASEADELVRPGDSGAAG